MFDRSLRCLLVFVIIAVMFSPSEAAKTKRRKSSASQQNTHAQAAVNISSLQGRWTGDGNGKGTDPHHPGVSLSLSAEDVVLEVENIKFSETTGEGMADVIFTGRITDISGNTRHLRTWSYSIPYDMKREGVSSWSFTTEYLDGEDKITLTLTSPTTAILRWEGANWDDVYPEDRDTFDVTCTAAKN